MLTVNGTKSKTLSETTPSQENLTEDDLREWLIRNTKEFFSENLLVIGREVKIEGIGDRIDVLAIDRDGNLVVLELKRGELTGNVDFQILKYVSYISRWEYSRIKAQFQRFIDTAWGREIYGEGADFNEELEEFCNDDYEVNGNQRMILIGNDIGDRVGSVVLWLREQGIDVSIANFSLFKHDSELYLSAETVIPTSQLERFTPGSETTNKPWKEDGHAWHIEERADPKTASLIEGIVSGLREVELFGEPSWGQKNYVSFRVNGKNRLLIANNKDWCKLKMIDYSVVDLDPEEIAGTLNVPTDRVRLREKSRKGKSEIWIDCYPQDDLSIENMREFVTEVVLSDGA